MAEQPTLGEFVLGFHGLAILRSWALDPPSVRARAQDMVEMTKHLGESPWSTPVVERSARVGYAQWAAIYDSPGNPMVMAEEPVVRCLVDSYPLGVVLDAACGTGRHAAYLDSLGHEVIGVDGSPEMLEQAKAKAPRARFEVADLSSISFPESSVDLAVCALALTHCQDLCPPVKELARIVRPSGRVIISDVHPFFVMLGGQGLYPHSEGELGLVWNHVHLTSDYLNAFQQAGLRVVRCIEPLWGDKELATAGFTPEMSAPMEAALRKTPIVIVWELEKGL